MSPISGRATKKSITGRDGYILIDALATSLIALEQLPHEQQPRSNMEDMKALLAAYSPPSGFVSLVLAQAKCRFRPDLDVEAVYREYGIDFGA